MKKNISILVIVGALLCSIGMLHAQQNSEGMKYFDWLNNVDVNQTVNNPNAKNLSLIKVQGNRFVDERGDTLLFRGVSIADPDKIEQEGRWNKNLFVKVKEFGATIVRIPVHPIAMAYAYAGKIFATP